MIVMMFKDESINIITITASQFLGHSQFRTEQADLYAEQGLNKGELYDCVCACAPVYVCT